MDEISELLRKLTPESGSERRPYLDRSPPPGLPSRSQRLQGAQAEPCERCGGAGFLLDDLPLGHPDYGTPVPCRCKLEERSQRRRSRFLGVNEHDALARFTFESFDPELAWLPPNERARLGRFLDAAIAFAEEPSGWLLLTGGYGCGKTHLAAAVANQRLEVGRPATFAVAPDLLDHLRMTFGPNSEASYDELFDEVRSTELLILDDLGAHSATPWAQEKLFQILNHRYNSQLPTLLTTNQRIEYLDPRLRSRLQDVTLVDRIHITAPDFRAGANARQGGLSTLSHHASQTFETFEEWRRNTTPEGLSSLRDALNQAKAYAENPMGWFVLTGDNGAGKTHLAAAISLAQSAVGQHEVLFAVVSDLLDYLRATFSSQSADSYERRFDELKRVPLLVLDDLGSESATPWAKARLRQLLMSRFDDALKPTVITTSIKAKDLEPWLETRIRDTSRCRVVEIKAGSFQVSADQSGPGPSLLKQEEPDPNVWRE
ncbi:MAG: ATP-binding protein [Caldilineaceae bacterium]|nr:ATP-binding protein [Caldilineaceae bacterium]MDE0429302.1 ATP-binding protein [Caldilineaceae bacterium]